MSIPAPEITRRRERMAAAVTSAARDIATGTKKHSVAIVAGILKGGCLAVVSLWWLTLGATQVWDLGHEIARQPDGPRMLFITASWAVLTLIGVTYLMPRRVAPHSHSALTPLAQAVAPTNPHTFPSRPRRARHEAAHAVAAWATGGIVTDLTLDETDRSGGQCIAAYDGDTLDPVQIGWGQLVMSVAGNEADLAAGCHDHASTDDMHTALYAALSLISTGVPPVPDAPLTVDGLMTAARAHARHLLHRHHDLMDALADLLLQVQGGRLLYPDMAGLARQYPATDPTIAAL